MEYNKKLKAKIKGTKRYKRLMREIQRKLKRYGRK